MLNKYHYALFLLPLILAAVITPQFFSKKANTVNSILGDISYIKKFGVPPNESTNEVLRIQAHLEYVEDLLRQKNVDHLPLHLKKKREQLLNLLHQYWVAANFPKNYDYPEERKPCFIDREGSICAVGYLIQQTAGQELAEKINAAFQYSYLSEIKMLELTEWVRNSGLTLDECAMIQPGYSYTKVDNYPRLSLGYYGGMPYTPAGLNFKYQFYLQPRRGLRLISTNFFYKTNFKNNNDFAFTAQARFPIISHFLYAPEVGYRHQNLSIHGIPFENRTVALLTDITLPFFKIRELKKEPKISVGVSGGAVYRELRELELSPAQWGKSAALKIYFPGSSFIVYHVSLFPHDTQHKVSIGSDFGYEKHVFVGMEYEKIKNYREVKLILRYVIDI